jgi:hypothetical protein
LVLATRMPWAQIEATGGQFEREQSEVACA